MTQKSWLSIIIPVYNERAFLPSLLAAVWQADSLGYKKEIIIVDDGSRDGSWPWLQRWWQRRRGRRQGKNWRVLLLRQEKNQGKGAALRRGILASRGEVVLIQDADLEYDPADYPLLLQPFRQGRADVVYGSRFLSGRPRRLLYYHHYLGNRLLTFLLNLTTNLNFSDVETGYKAFRGDLIRRLAPQLRGRGFDFEVEVSWRLARQPGIRFYEVGISYWGRTYRQGKKANWRDGWRALWRLGRLLLAG